MPTNNQHYPSPLKTGDLDNDWRLLFNHMYAQQSKNDELTKQLSDLKDSHSKLQQQVANGPSTTKIAGLYVKGVQPEDGQVLTYKAASGQIEFA